MNLGIYMGKAVGWKALPNKARPTNMPDLGPQKCWEKENSFVLADDGNEVFP